MLIHHLAIHLPTLAPHLAVLPVVGVVAETALSSVFGHHNSYPNGNPDNLTKFDAIARQAAAGDQASVDFMRQVIAGNVITNGPGSVWWNAGDHVNPVVDWGEQSPGRAAERAYMQHLYSGLFGQSNPTPVGGQTPNVSAMAAAVDAGGTDLGNVLQATLRQAIATGGASLTSPAFAGTFTPAAKTVAAGNTGSTAPGTNIKAGLTSGSKTLLVILAVVLGVFVVPAVLKSYRH